MQRAVDIFGTQEKLASALAARTGVDVRQGHVWAWINRYAVPTGMVLAIEALCAERGHDVPREDLRPDIGYDAPRPAIQRRAA